MDTGNREDPAFAESEDIREQRKPDPAQEAPYASPAKEKEEALTAGKVEASESGEAKQPRAEQEQEDKKGLIDKAKDKLTGQ